MVYSIHRAFLLYSASPSFGFISLLFKLLKIVLIPLRSGFSHGRRDDISEKFREHCCHLRGEQIFLRGCVCMVKTQSKFAFTNDRKARSCKQRSLMAFYSRHYLIHSHHPFFMLTPHRKNLIPPHAARSRLCHPFL